MNTHKNELTSGLWRSLVAALACAASLAQSPSTIQTETIYNFSQDRWTTASYQLDLDAPAEVRMQVGNWVSTYDWAPDLDRIYVFNSANEPVAISGFASADNPYLFHMFQNAGTLVFRVGQAGPYRIAIYSGRVAQTYTLFLSAIKCKDTYEFNDSMATATAIQLGQTNIAYQWRQANTSAINGDEDWYKVTLPGPGKLRIELWDWVTGRLDWSSDYDRLYVYNAEGVSIGTKGGTDS